MPSTLPAKPDERRTLEPMLNGPCGTGCQPVGAQVTNLCHTYQGRLLVRAAYPHGMNLTAPTAGALTALRTACGGWALAFTAILALTAAGCQHLFNPYEDELAGLSEPTTASVEGAGAAPSQPTLQPRGFEPFLVETQDGSVAHWPLWWEDPFEDKGSEDDLFAWTWEDYLGIPYGSGRFLLNTMGFPVSAYLTKPFTVMCSDGRLSRQALGYDHDATPCPGGASPPIDILELGTYPEEEDVEEAPGAPPAAEDQGPAETG